jgi:hypothetical protein
MKLYFALPLLLLFACTNEREGSDIQEPAQTVGWTESEITEISDTTKGGIETNTKVEESIKPSYSSEVIYTENIGWGYEILQGESVVIKQTYIPAIQGNYAFETEEDARKTAEFILGKLNNNIFPPTLSREELTYLDVLP